MNIDDKDEKNEVRLKKSEIMKVQQDYKKL